MATEGGELKTWVSDRLVALLGCSQGIVVRLVLRLARDCASAGDLAARLVDLAGFPSSPDTAAFAADVYARLPRRDRGKGQGTAPGISEFKPPLDDGGGKEEARVAAATASSKISSGGGGKRFRKKGDNGEAAALSDPGRNVRRRPESGENGGDPDEEEEMRRRDQADRARLERNIRSRDEASTRRLISMDRKPSRKREHEEELARRPEAAGGGDISELRRASRRAYLESRVKKKMEELLDEIIDEEHMFSSAPSGRRAPRRCSNGGAIFGMYLSK